MDGELSVKFIQSASIAMRALGHPVRIKIIEYLRGGKKSVGQIQKIINLSQPVTSQHLRFMYSRGIVDYIQDGTTYNYFIANEFINKIYDCISDCQEKIQSGEWNLELMNLEEIEVKL